ncbi:uncharacterized protein EDB93DRAFT_1102424 [Suillus bovinus]|uniref:uncharacterized protein n=1 Tax=Suillus bovinus TaxID=48563 RepID=UPI001B87CAC0|nr:uncharacterized protein EDB93DRAFT_1102424 [Suillus bovinus]KAG2154294.1 hypothetical protein EDB93DRAFT_1102424 [Suillus bovinus]
MATCKVGPRRKVGPAHIMKTKHKFLESKLLQDPEASPVPEGSVVDGGGEPIPTDDDSGKLADDTTVVDSERPPIRHSDDEDVTLEFDYQGGPDVQLLPKKRNLHQREQASLTVRQGGEEHELSSDSDAANDPPAKSKQGATGKTSLPHISPALPGRKDKGKMRKLPPPTEIEDLNNDQNDVNIDKNSGDSLMSGQLPQEAINKAIALGKKTVEEAKNIANEYGKSVCTILIQARLSVKPTRAENSWNMYQVWYKMQHPKSSDDIYVGGFVLYTGTEEAGQRAVGVFAGSPLILDLVNEKQVDIKKLVDYLTTVIK